VADLSVLRGCFSKTDAVVDPERVIIIAAHRGLESMLLIRIFGFLVSPEILTP
jgi:hypothetical protein